MDHAAAAADVSGDNGTSLVVHIPAAADSYIKYIVHKDFDIAGAADINGRGIGDEAEPMHVAGAGSIDGV